MPLKRRGSVRARLRVWFAERRTAAKRDASEPSTSMPPGSRARRPSSPATTWSEARFCEPASVQRRVPAGKSNAARPRGGEILARRARQCSRPAIIRCRTSQRPSSRPMQMRFPNLCRRVTFFPAAVLKRAHDAHAFERLAENTRLERLDIDNDVRQFRHALAPAILPGRTLRILKADIAWGVTA